MLAAATVLWGANFNLAKHVLADMDALTAAAARFGLAAFVMLLLCALRRERVPLLRHGHTYALLGLVGIVGFNVLFFYGMRSTSAVNGALIMAINPLLTAVLAFMLTEARLRPRQLAALPLALGGVAFVVLGGGARVHVESGDLMVLAGNVCWALYNVLVVLRLPREVGGLANTAGIMTAGALILSAIAWAAGARVAIPHGGALASLLIMSLGGSVLAYLFWNAGIARLGAARAALFMNLVPVSSMAIAALEGQAPSAVQLAGAGAVIGAVMLASWPAAGTLPAPPAAAGRCGA